MEGKSVRSTNTNYDESIDLTLRNVEKSLPRKGEDENWMKFEVHVNEKGIHGAEDPVANMLE